LYLCLEPQTCEVEAQSFSPCNLFSPSNRLIQTGSGDLAGEFCKPLLRKCFLVVKRRIPPKKKVTAVWLIFCMELEFLSY
jgi:hypothetical protein